MLQITARLFKDGQLVGYRLTDGTQTQDLTKIQAWMYAKNKQIINVTATGTQDDPQLSGTNGFKLKELPEIKFGQPTTPVNGGVDSQTISAALIRYTMKHGIQKYKELEKRELVEFGKQLINKEFTNDYVRKNNRRYSNSLVITHKVGEQCDNSPFTLGYIVKNIGKEPIAIDRVTVYPISKVPTVLNPGQSIALSRAEVAVLSAKPEVNGKFANAKIQSGSMWKLRNIYEYLHCHYIKLLETDNICGRENVNMSKVASEEEIAKYFYVGGKCNIPNNDTRIAI